MGDRYYTLGVWRAKKGREKEFIDAWQELGTAFFSLPTPSGTGTLLQSLEDPEQFYSFGPWPSLEAIQSMRDDPEAGKALGTLTALCEEAKPGAFRMVARVVSPWKAPWDAELAP
jgi:hypothetical protein